MAQLSNDQKVGGLIPGPCSLAPDAAPLVCEWLMNADL